jgi:predicted ATPase/Tfp pilus assembly protein PilF
VATTIAHTIGIREGGGRPPLENLKDYLAARQMLLIFDNFEQVIEAAADVSQLLSAGPGIKGLVTSRVPLRLRWEHEYAVSPLDMPPDVRQSLDEALEYESVALFQQQARAVRPGFEITDENQAAVAEICRRLDGLPLAIEIAAARIRMLTPQALLKRLDQSLNLLVGGAKDLPSRQQTLRRTIDWSYELLEPEVQSLFTRLGIFAGGFTLEAAEEVCNPDGDMDVFAGVETLLTSSLLRQVKSVSDEPRFDMLQTIREYALEKVQEAEILDDLRWAHCGYFEGLAGGEMDAGIYGPQSVMWLQRIDEEGDNFRVALSWALDHEGGLPAAVAMLTPLFWYWYRFGHLQEGRDMSARAMAATAGLGDSPLHALVLVFRGYLLMWSGELTTATQLAGSAVEMCRRLKFDQGMSWAKLGYGTALINQGRDKEAYPQLVDAVELFDNFGITWFIGTVLVHLANVSLGLGQAGQALQWLDKAMPHMKENGDVWNMAFALSNYGEVARAQGDYEKAEQYYRQTEALYRQADARGDQARLVNVLGYIAQHKGEFSRAHALFLQGLNDFRELGNHRGIAECLAGLSGLAAEEGQPRWAAPLLSAAESQLKALGGAWWPADRVEIERARERMQSALGDQFGDLWAQGQSMSVEDAIAYAESGWQSP